MQSTWITIIIAIVGIVSSITGWFVRVLWEAQAELRKDLKTLEGGLPDLYVRRDDYRDDMSEIKTLLNRIFDKLDNKADK
jgi:hypothetical protein